VYDAWFSCASNQVQLQNQLKSQFIIWQKKS
jgi:hypothetical protein